MMQTMLKILKNKLLLQMWIEILGGLERRLLFWVSRLSHLHFLSNVSWEKWFLAWKEFFLCCLVVQIIGGIPKKGKQSKGFQSCWLKTLNDVDKNTNVGLESASKMEHDLTWSFPREWWLKHICKLEVPKKVNDAGLSIFFTWSCLLDNTWVFFTIVWTKYSHYHQSRVFPF